MDKHSVSAFMTGFSHAHLSLQTRDKENEITFYRTSREFCSLSNSAKFKFGNIWAGTWLIGRNCDLLKLLFSWSYNW